MATDRIYKTTRDTVDPFQFDRGVAEVFDDMVERSVPFYQDVQKISEQVVGRFVQPSTAVYDLGCSTGTSLVRVAVSSSDIDYELIGVDESAEMLEKCRLKLQEHGLIKKVSLVESSIQSMLYAKTSVTLLNLTLMFLHESERLSVLKKVHQAMIPGGALLLTEKVAADDSEIAEFINFLQDDFKRSCGYSEIEISQKRAALDGVLRPKSLSDNIELLSEAGFTRSEVVLRCPCFASILAIK